MTPAQFVAAVDAFMDMKKRLIGADVSPTWQAGRDPDQLRLKLPLELDGVQHGQTLCIDAHPAYPTLRFYIMILFAPEGPSICRLDYRLDDIHPNNADSLVKLPSMVCGPHYHAWRLNRHLAKSTAHALPLPNATPLPKIRQFDAALRWFCSENKIILPPGHRIELPAKERLL